LVLKDDFYLTFETMISSNPNKLDYCVIESDLT